MFDRLLIFIIFLALVEVLWMIPVIVVHGVADGIIPVWVALGGYFIVTFLEGWLVWDISKDFPRKEEQDND